MAGSVIVLVTAYFLLPLEPSSAGAAITTLIVGLMVFVALAAFQVRSVLRSPFAGLRAVEALTISVPFSAVRQRLRPSGVFAFS